MPCAGPKIPDYTYHTPPAGADEDLKFLMWHGYDAQRAKAILLSRFVARVLRPNTTVPPIERRPPTPQCAESNWMEKHPTYTVTRRSGREH
ncbi:hypothetical protein TWF281_011134 [Arthrobotrys megalospora]